jgi:hypothetical protein
MKYNKVYILAPSNYITGGVEAMFQLCDAINSVGGSGELILVPVENPIVPDEYLRYNAPVATEVINQEDSLVIVPEIWPHMLSSPLFSNMTKAIWWLSVDNCHDKEHAKRNDILHLYQSHYAKDFLVNNGITNPIPLFDYINDDYKGIRTPIKLCTVCYSIKGKDVAEMVKEHLPSYISLVMLKDMSRQQVLETLKTSMVFMDFGHHPGKDRIPREAALLNNCIVTNRSGSANFFNDVPIHDKYKLSGDSIKEIASLIEDCIFNYSTAVKDFSKYKKKILSQKREFFEQAKSLIK